MTEKTEADPLAQNYINIIEQQRNKAIGDLALIEARFVTVANQLVETKNQLDAALKELESLKKGGKEDDKSVNQDGTDTASQ